jgi:hypothetical protein
MRRTRRAGALDGREDEQLEPWHCSEVVVELEHVGGPGPWSGRRTRRAGAQDGREEEQLEPWHCSEVVVELEHVGGSGPWSGMRTRRDRGPRWA